MAFYQDSDSLQEVMLELFRRLSQDPEAAQEFRQSKMLVRFQFTDPELDALINGKEDPIAVTVGNYDGRVDLGLGMAADVLHEVWLGKIRLRDAFFSGQIKVSGNFFRAVKLEGIFRRSEVLYPQVLADLGYEV